MTVDEILAGIRTKTGQDPRPAGDRQWSARCPAHADRKPSLSIGVGEGGRILLHCHAGCTSEQIVDSLGLEVRDLFTEPRRFLTPRRIVATYDYRDQDGQLLFQSVRFEPKRFGQRRPGGAGDWTWNLSGVPRVLYRLPELIAADPSEVVFVTEGEKDADSLAGLGLTATTNPMGAKKWSCLSDDSALYDRRVAVIPDRDDVGGEHALDVATRLYGKAKDVRIVELPDGHGKDASDWIGSMGPRAPDELRDALLAMFESAPPFDPNAAPAEDGNVAPAFRTICELVEENPTLHPPIVQGVLRRREIMNVIAASKTGKSWFVGDLALAVATGRPWLGFETVPGQVLLIDNELHPATLANRLPKIAAARGLDLADVADGLAVESLRGRLVDLHAMEPYFQALPPDRFRIIILDALYRFLPKGVDENDNGAVAQLYNLLDRWAERLGCAFVCVHHASKGNQSAKAITDVGSGAGAQSRATDAHLVLRPHEEDDVAVLQAAVRSFPPVEPFCLRWMFPVWTLAYDLDPSALRRAPGRRRRRPKPETPSEPSEPPWTPERFAESFIEAGPRVRAAILMAANEQDLSDNRAEKLLRCAEVKGLVHRWRLKGNRYGYASEPQPHLDLDKKKAPKTTKREQMEALLKESPDLSSRELAERCDVSKRYANQVRREVLEDGN